MHQTLDDEIHELDPILGLNDDRSDSKGFATSTLSRIERTLTKCFYRMNFSLLSMCVQSKLFYHVVILFEFLQLVYFQFVNVSIANEFSWVPLGSDSSSLTGGSSTSSSGESGLGLETDIDTISSGVPTTNSTQSLSSDVASGQVQDQVRIDQLLDFTHFHLYLFTSRQNFFYLFSFLGTGGLFLVILLILAISNNAFDALRKDTLGTTQKMLLKGFSILMIGGLLTNLQIPILVTLLEGFKCGGSDSYFTCDEGLFRLVNCISALSIVFYLVFIVIQVKLFQTTNLDSKLPWCSFTTQVPVVRQVQKLILCVTFAFDRSEASLAAHIIHLFSAGMTFFILKRRVKDAFYFDKSVQHATVVYEGVLLNVQVAVPLIYIMGGELNLTVIFIMVLSALLVLGYAFSIYSLNLRGLLTKDSHSQYAQFTEKDYEVYIYALHETIKKGSPTSQVLVLGQLFEHLWQCDSLDCICVSITESLDGINKFKKEKHQRQEDEKVINQSFDSEQVKEKMGMSLNQTQVDQQILVEDITAHHLAPVKNQKMRVTCVNAKSSQQLINELSQGGKSPHEFARTVPVSPEEPPEEEDILAIRREMMHSALEQLAEIEEKEAAFYEPERLKRKFFKFLGVKILEAIALHPMSADLKILHSYIQLVRLKNQFKSVFELMNTENCNPTISQKFLVFKRKIEIQQHLLKQHDKSIQSIGYLDPNIVLSYERAFQRYQLNEHLAVRAATLFWRELLQSVPNSTVIHEQGVEVSRSFRNILNSAKELQSIYPMDMKFLYKYGIFLIKVINNEYEGIAKYEQAQQIYHNRFQKQFTSAAKTQSTLFGENTGAGVIIVEATSQSFGTVIHSNDELEHVLGYSRADLIGQNINYIMPPAISKNHTKIFQHYLDTGKSTVIDKIRQVFALSKQGYLQLTQLLVKVHPQIDGRILFIGLFQRVEFFTDMPPPKQEYLNLEQHFMVTDDEGNIKNVSQGLYKELGLHESFFSTNFHASFQTNINMSEICPKITRDDAVYKLQNNLGTHLSFDTTGILQRVDVEQISMEELNYIQANISKQKAYVAMKRFELGGGVMALTVYRLIFVNSVQNQSSGSQVKNLRLATQYVSKNASSRHPDHTRVQGEESMDQEENDKFMQQEASLSGSVSSTGSTSTFIENDIKTFKMGLESQAGPRSLRTLSAAMIILNLIIVGMQIVYYFLVRDMIQDMSEENGYHQQSDQRSYLLILLATNMRSLVNIASGFEKPDTMLTAMANYSSRFGYLSRNVILEHDLLYQKHQDITRHRENKGQAAFEFQSVEMLRITDKNGIDSKMIPYRLALLEYLNDALMINQTTAEQLKMPAKVITSEPLGRSKVELPSTSYLNKMEYSLITNGIRTLRRKTAAVNDFINAEIDVSNIPLLMIMVLVIVTLLFGIFFMQKSIFQIERIQGSIIAFYALVPHEEIAENHEKCMAYMSMLVEGSFVKMIKVEDDEGEAQNSPIQRGSNQGSDYNGGAKSLALVRLNGRDLGLTSTIQKIGFTDKQYSNSGLKSEARELKPELRRTSGIRSGLQIVPSQLHLPHQHHHHHHHHEGNNDYEGSEASLTSSIDSYHPQQQIEDIKFDEVSIAKPYQSRIMNLEPGSQIAKVARVDSGSVVSKRPGILGIPGLSKNECMFTSIMVKYMVEIKSMNEVKKLKTTRMDEAKILQLKQTRIAEEEPQDKEPEDDTNHSHTESHHEEKKIPVKKKQSAHPDNSSLRRKSVHSKKGGRKRRMTLQIPEILHEVPIAEEIEYRKHVLMTNLNTTHTFITMLKSCLLLLMSIYFILVYILDGRQDDSINGMRSHTSSFYDRFSNIMLTYNLLRERVIFNNSLDSFESDPVHGYNMDDVFLERSIASSQEIMDLKQRPPQILEEIVNYFKEIDSDKFCNGLAQYREGMKEVSVNDGEQSGSIVNYDLIIKTLVKTQIAAYSRDLLTLKSMVEADPSVVRITDYDQRTVLKYGVASGSLEIVKYLVQNNARVNGQDRWDCTSMDYAPTQQIHDYLHSMGLQKSCNFTLNLSLEGDITKLSDSDFKLFYAAKYGDLKTAAQLFTSGKANIYARDIDGRSPLMVAASEGKVQFIQYFANLGVDLTGVDIRGTNAQQAAHLEGFIALRDIVANYIADTIIRQNCNAFAQGLFRQGVQQGIANMHKKYADIRIKITEARSHQERLNMIQVQSENGQLNMQVVFQQAQELFFIRMLSSLDQTIKRTYESNMSDYSTLILSLFLVCFGLQMIFVVYIRPYLITILQSNISESRGILYLVPTHIIENNKREVDQILNILHG